MPSPTEPSRIYLKSSNKNLIRIATASLLASFLAIAFGSAPQALAYQHGQCAVTTKQLGFKVCESGNRDSQISVALIGDSHTRSWFNPTRELAKKYGWKLTSISKSACPPLDPKIMPTSLPSETCKPWNESLWRLFDGDPGFDLVINANSSYVTHGYQSYAKAFASMVKRITAKGSTVLVIRDNPKPLQTVISCLKVNAQNAASACSVSRSMAMKPKDPMPAAVSGLPGVLTADFTDSFCGPSTCLPIIDGITVYRDYSHMSPTWALHLTPVLDAAIPAKFKG